MTMQPDTSLAADPVIVLTRVLDAPRTLVWKMFTEPEHLKKWWGPAGFSAPVVTTDLRVGGQWHYILRAPDGSEFPINHYYHEIVAPERIVYSNDEEFNLVGGGALPQHGLSTLTFDEQNGKTTVNLRLVFGSAADRDAQVQRGFVSGVSGGLDRLVEYVKTL